MRRLAAVLCATVLVGCGADAPAERGQGGAWSFVDDRGVEVELDAAPRRIVAHEEAAAALIALGIKPIGIFGAAPLDRSPVLAGLDVGGIASLGAAYGEVNLEALAALRPEAIVTHLFPGAPPLWGFADERQEERVGRLAPLIALDATVPATEALTRMEALAGALGVDTETRVATDRQRMEAALEELREAIAEKPGLRVAALTATQDALFVAQPDDYPDLLEFERIGVQLVAPDSSEPYWEQLSWENAGKYAADVLLYDVRPHALPLGQLSRIPTWRRLPAVRAGQVGRWPLGMATSYERFAQQLEELAALVRDARPLRG